MNVLLSCLLSPCYYCAVPVLCSTLLCPSNPSFPSIRPIHHPLSRVSSFPPQLNSQPSPPTCFLFSLLYNHPNTANHAHFSSSSNLIFLHPLHHDTAIIRKRHRCSLFFSIRIASLSACRVPFPQRFLQPPARALRPPVCPPREAIPTSSCDQRWPHTAHLETARSGQSRHPTRLQSPQHLFHPLPVCHHPSK